MENILAVIALAGLLGLGVWLYNRRSEETDTQKSAGLENTGREQSVQVIQPCLKQIFSESPGLKELVNDGPKFIKICGNVFKESEKNFLEYEKYQQEYRELIFAALLYKCAIETNDKGAELLNNLFETGEANVRDIIIRPNKALRLTTLRFSKRRAHALQMFCKCFDVTTFVLYGLDNSKAIFKFFIDNNFKFETIKSLCLVKAEIEGLPYLYSFPNVEWVNLAFFEVDVFDLASLITPPNEKPFVHSKLEKLDLWKFNVTTEIKFSPETLEYVPNLKKLIISKTFYDSLNTKFRETFDKMSENGIQLIID